MHNRTSYITAVSSMFLSMLCTTIGHYGEMWLIGYVIAVFSLVLIGEGSTVFLALLCVSVGHYFEIWSLGYVIAIIGSIFIGVILSGELS